MKTIPLILTCVLASTLANCAVTTAGVKKGDERNLSRSFNDVSAKRVIVARMQRADSHKLSGVNVDVAEGIAVLTGNVLTPEARVEAERVAWSAPNIVQVGNEILIKDKQGFVRNSKDGVLQQSIRTRLTANKSVKGRNFNLEVHDGIVYLLGVARTPDELARAAQIASTTRGTREVISYVKIHGDDITQTAQSPSYGSAPAPAYGPSYNELGYNAPPSQAEPYYVDPQTGERVEIPPGVTPIPYTPQATAPQRLSNLGPQLGKTFPPDQELGQYRSGRSGEAVSVIESAPYYIDPDTGQEVPVSHVRGNVTTTPYN